VNVTEITTFAHSTQGRGYYPHPLYSGKGLLPSPTLLHPLYSGKGLLPSPTLLREGATTLTHSTQGRGLFSIQGTNFLTAQNRGLGTALHC